MIRVQKGRAMVGLVASIVAFGGCEDLLGPSASAEVYVLTSIAGIPTSPTLNLHTIWGGEYAAAGAQLIILGDTLLLHSGGRGEERNAIRYRTPCNWYATCDTLLRDGSHQHGFSYFRGGPDIRTVQWESGDPAWKVYRRGAGGSLEGDGQGGVWRFERRRR